MAYKCSTCFAWIPREQHSQTCPRVAAPAFYAFLLWVTR